HTSPDYGQWRGIKFDSTTAVSELSYCIISYGAFFDTDTLTERGKDAQHYRGALAIRNCSPVIEHCIGYYNQNNAVYIEGEAAAPIVRYCIFTKNDASGVRADTTVIVGLDDPMDISYNCVADNSAPPFIMGMDTTYYGVYARVNNNVDSCDVFFNIDLPPLLTDPRGGLTADVSDFTLQSCSPCIDAGPFGDDFTDPDPDGTIADMGTIYYQRQGFELRGRTSGDLPAATYRLTCNIVIPEEEYLTIPAGTRIEADGVYQIRVLGRLNIEGTIDNRVLILPAENSEGLWNGITFADRAGQDPSTVRFADISGYDALDVYKPGTEFQNVDFSNAFTYGMMITTQSLETADQVVLDHCSFENCGTFALSADSCGVKILNNSIYGSKGRGIALSQCFESVEIKNTIIRACSTSALVMSNNCSPQIVNNVFVDCGYYGMEAYLNSFPEFVNNIVTNNGRAGLYVHESTTPTLKYNNVYDNGFLTGDDAINYLVGGTGGSFLIPENSIEADPLFTASFTLGSGSPCIDTGDPTLSDPDGSRSDMGAFGGPGAGTVGHLMAGPIHAFANR
ncbi:right-handed parallel beta-helix repeat-containing protein, partial [bacterium]|nr:right-handed parallel beta-helix repeat-containing protein [bacterium]